MLKGLSLALVIACGPCSARADDNAPDVARGVGANRCSDFRLILDRDPQFAKAAFLSWADGFMAGANNERIDEKKALVNVNSKSHADLWAYLTLFCDKNPQKPFVLGVMELYLTLPTLSN